MNSTVRHVRAIARVLALLGVTLFFYALRAGLMPFLLGSAKARYRWRNFNFRGWARATAALLRMRVNLKGAAPRAPFFLVSNHLSYLDIVAFASQLDCVFVAKQEVAGWPVLGWLCRNMDTIFVDRNSRLDVLRVNALIKEALGAGKGVLLFPEGTSTSGAEVLRFHSALFEPAVTRSYPVSYATIGYQTPPGQPPAHLSVCWWGEMTFLPHVYRLLQLTSFEATLVFGSHAIRADDRKTLAQRLRQAVKEQLLSAVHTERPEATTPLHSWIKREPGGANGSTNPAELQAEPDNHPPNPLLIQEGRHCGRLPISLKRERTMISYTRGAMQTPNSLIRENIEILKQGVDLLTGLDDQTYPQVRHPFAQYGIGSHFRHCLDFYHSFLRGVEDGRVDYDDRERDERIEKDRLAAISRFEATIRRLEGLPRLDDQMPLMVRLEDAGEQQDPSSWSCSSVMRELQSLVSHTVHHYALIAVMLQLNGFEPAEGFGVAPSTLKQWRATAPCAQ